MNRSLIRTVSILIIISPFILVSSVFTDVFYIIAGVIILGATVDITKKKKIATDPEKIPQ
jgi:hypothetical protein